MITMTPAQPVNRRELETDELRCVICHRVHRPEPDDAESHAVVRICRLIIVSEHGGDDGTDDAAATAVCDDCRAQINTEGRTHVGNGLFVSAAEPLSAVEQLRAVDLELSTELLDVEQHLAGTGKQKDVVVGDRAHLYATADRILYRQARDRAEAAAQVRAAQLEADAILRRAKIAAGRIERQMWWRQVALEELAKELFPDASAKRKSVSLTYGSIGRKDFKPAPELVDDEAALAACRASGDLDPYVVVEFKTSREQLRLALAHIVASIGKPVDESMTPGSTVYSVDDALEYLVASVEPDFSVAWSRLKKVVADGVIPPPEGVAIAPSRTEFFATVTEG